MVDASAHSVPAEETLWSAAAPRTDGRVHRIRRWYPQFLIGVILFTAAAFLTAGNATTSLGEHLACRGTYTPECEEADTAFYFYAFLLVLTTTATMFVLLFGIALLLHRGRQRRYHQEVEPRRLAASTALAGGQLSSVDFKLLERAYAGFSQAAFPGGPTRVAAQALLFVAVPALLASFIFLYALTSESRSPFARPETGELPFLAASFTFLLCLGAFGLARGILLHIRHRNHLRQARRDLAALEGAILVSGSFPSPTLGARSDGAVGPTFRSWLEHQ